MPWDPRHKRRVHSRRPGDAAAPREIEGAINEADKLDLVSPDGLRRSLDDMKATAARRPGVGRLRSILDRHSFVLTDSELERRFLSLVRRAGLPEPETGRYVNGFKVDFFWPQLGLVVETDGLRYHRTPAQQTRDRRRDQVHAATGLRLLRFTHAQVRYEPAHVVSMLAAVGRF
jgi:very-short-patch-repair endonuclease